MIPNAPDALERRYDVTIIGGGAAGGVAAKELTDRGLHVAVLEAGSNYEAEDFAPFEQIYQASRFWSGGFETDKFFNFIFVRGKGVGGSTLVNQCLIDRFTPEVFESWRSVSGKSEFNAEEMNRWYNKVEGELQLDVIDPDTFNPNNQTMVRGMEACGFKWKPLRRGQTHCEDCIHCLGGCPLGSKQGTNETFFKKAREDGCEIIANCDVDSVEFGSVGSDHTINLYLDGKKQQFKAPLVVFAAGTLGTTKILLKSNLKDRLPAIGENFACHPQRLVFGEFEDDLHLFDGSFQAVASDDERFVQDGFKLECIAGPPITAAIAMGDFGADHKRKLRRIRHFGALESAIRDDNAGKISLDKKGRLVIDKPLTDSDNEKLKKALDAIHSVLDAAGAISTDVIGLDIGLHLQGACRLGTHPSTSVVNHNWEIHGIERAFVCDASTFPTSTGINLVDTVMAQAAMASEKIAGEAG